MFKSRQKKCSDEPFVVRVLAIKSAHKSGEFYKVTAEFDDSTMSDSHCTCYSGVRALPCCHVVAVMISLGRVQGNSESTTGQKSLDTFNKSVCVPPRSR